MVRKRGERGPGKQPKCRGDSEKCHRCVRKIGCCLKKPTPCGKRDCVVCSPMQQADGAATTPTVGKRSSRTRKKTPEFAAAGSGSGENKPKYATKAAECEARKERKKEQAKYKKKEEEKKKQPDRGTCVS